MKEKNVISTEETKNADFCMLIEDNSLISFGIKENSTIIVKSQNFASNGNLIVCKIDKAIFIARYFNDGQNTILTFGGEKEPLIFANNLFDLECITIVGKVVACQYPIN